jgi:hypothetical protein
MLDFDVAIERARIVPIEDVILRHGIALRRVGAERIGPCPRCGGVDRFSINPSKGVFNCRQCAKGGDVIALTEFLNDCDFNQALETLNGEQIAKRPQKPNGKHQAQGPQGPGVIVGVFPYHDEHGALLYEVVKYFPKTFRQRQPDGFGGYIDNVRGVRMVPYHLPELIEAIANDRVIFICEGEKDVDNVIALGAPATCNPRGAGKWQSCRLDHHFDGARVVIIADNDPQSIDAHGKPMFHQDGRPRCVGWDHANDVAEALSTIAASVKVIDLAKVWPKCPPKGDISDWIEAKDGAITIDALYEIADRASEWTPAVRDRAKEPERLILIDAGDDPGFIEPRPWLLGNQFCRGYISSLVAAGGVGKSALRLLQFVSLATGRELSGEHIFKRSRVLLISMEDDAVELQRRIQAVCLYHEVQRGELKDWLKFSCPKAKLAEYRNDRFRQRVVGELDRMIRETIEEFKPDIVALDPFVKLHALLENDSGDMNFVCDLLIRIAVECDVAVDIPHHVHKGLIEAGDADAGRGSSGIRDASRLVFTLTQMTKEEAANYSEVKEEDIASYVRLDTGKINIAAHSKAITWFRLVGEPIGNFKPPIYPNGDTIQVVTPWKPKALMADLDIKTINAILDDITKGFAEHEFFSAAKAADERAAWRIVKIHCKNKTDKQCRRIINTWLESGLLVEFEYQNKKYKTVRGLKVDDRIRRELPSKPTSTSPPSDRPESTSNSDGAYWKQMEGEETSVITGPYSKTPMEEGHSNASSSIGSFTEYRSLGDDGSFRSSASTASRPKPFRIISDCTEDVACLHCFQTGNVKRLTWSNAAPGSKSETLHIDCAEAYFEKIEENE